MIAKSTTVTRITGTEEVIAHLGRQRILSRGGKVPLCRVWGWLDRDVVFEADEDGSVDGLEGPQEVRGPERGRAGYAWSRWKGRLGQSWLFQGHSEDQFLMTPLRGGQPELGRQNG